MLELAEGLQGCHTHNAPGYQACGQIMPHCAGSDAMPVQVLHGSPVVAQRLNGRPAVLHSPVLPCFPLCLVLHAVIQVRMLFKILTFAMKKGSLTLESFC